MQRRTLTFIRFSSGLKTTHKRLRIVLEFNSDIFAKLNPSVVLSEATQSPKYFKGVWQPLLLYRTLPSFALSDECLLLHVSQVAQQ